jgi:hypothetical protein
MPTYQFLTDRSLAQSTAITPTTIIHIVTTADTTQSVYGSSYKAELQQLIPIFSGSTFSGGSGNCITDLYTSNIHSCSPLNINPLDEGNVYFGSTSGVTVDVVNSRLGVGTETPTDNLTVSGSSFFNTSSLTTGTTPAFKFLDGVSTPTDTTTVKSVYKEFRPTTKTTTRVVGDGTLLYPNINSSSSAIFYAKANLTLYTDNLSLLTSNEALNAETNVIQIQSSSGTYSGVTMGTMSVLRNITAGGTIDKYVGFWMNGFDVNYTHNGTTNNIYGFYMDSQSGRSGNVPPTTNRYGVYIEDVGRNYFAGTVGIGTTSPSEKLEVSGNTLISGGMSASTMTITNPYVPTGSTDPTGTEGTISWSGDTLYFRNTTGWVRITGQTSW